jgi:hypothetical protein
LAEFFAFFCKNYDKAVPQRPAGSPILQAVYARNKFVPDKAHLRRVRAEKVACCDEARSHCHRKKAMCANFALKLPVLCKAAMVFLYFIFS